MGGKPDWHKLLAAERVATKAPTRRRSAVARMRAGLAVLAFALTSLVLLPLQIIAVRFDLGYGHHLPRRFHRIACRLLGLKVTVIGAPHPGRPLLLAVNHSSWIDIVALGSVTDVVFIAKEEVKSWPLFGLFARLQRSVFVQREARRTTGRQVAEIAGRLAAGEIVVLFAEGTTSDGNRVLPFKSSLFGAAQAAIPEDKGGVAVQPVSIAYTRVHGLPMGRAHRQIAAWPGDVALLPHLFGVLTEGAIDVEIRCGEPVTFSAESNRKAVTRIVEDRVRALHRQSLHGGPARQI